ncbi:MAG: ABC transporter [Curvibacter sp. RIFCSPHIGHO2_12_FULL_63_18]|uniref:metal ABC transporter ATP-binding protein n=1 Tax=Rhodoferax sp. TaxID=50421 RepID=UPI0008AB4A08|nr:metal ABC transporter ATP-binding protein [Rhodoferax sp.]OGO98134.1 MAG: ABC transporter [Curvibacter sp. GWA2_63_95]OGP00147.1 MAG: ABC transporter [Curvibacter sp. RIFCSPHIGHO2_12_FULL_63_18]HCX82841.1 ABC transporter [Rhodoferax sp.]
MNRPENTAGATTPAITLHNLTVSYRRHPALHHVSGHFARGALTAIIGPNGAGKSTLLKSLARLVPVAPHARITHALGERLAYLPQHSELDRSFPLGVRDCVLMGLWAQTSAWGSATAPMLARVDAALEAVGLQGFEHRTVGTLSSGQLQRALFARLLVQDAQTILLDEPFNAVDSQTTAALLALVRQWHRQGRTVIAVLHDDAQVREYFPHTLLLARECIAWGPTAEVLTDPNLQRARAMAEAWDETAAICDIDGQVNGQDFDTLLAQRLASTA